MYFFYRFLLICLFPFIWIRLLWRSRHLPAYRQHWAERLGFPAFRLKDPCIVLHCVSLGETIAAEPIIRRLQAQFPQYHLILTSMTPTGRAKAQTYANDRTHVCYLPYDYPFAIQAFLARVPVKILFFMETELWPMWLHLAGRRGIPCYLLNGRLSERSAKAYGRFGPWARRLFQGLRGVVAQHENDAKHFRELAYPTDRLFITGSIKFDIQIPEEKLHLGQAFREAWGTGRLIWIAASTHDREEEAILHAHQQLKALFPGLGLILVPRHPERFQLVRNLCTQMGFKLALRSEGLPKAETEVFLGDTVGEMFGFYAAADLAFVGGSLFPPGGGHNPLEPACLSLPIFVGHHTCNFLAIVKSLLEAKALRCVSEENLVQVLAPYLQETALRREMGDNAFAFMKANRGALERQWALIKQWMQAI